MKKILILAATLLCSVYLMAQMSQSNGNLGKLTNNGHVYGKVTDSLGNALPNVSILLLQKKADPSSGKVNEILIKGATTRNNGEFDFEELPTTGKLVLKISGSGYIPSQQTILFTKNTPASGPKLLRGNVDPLEASGVEKDLGEIVLTSSSDEVKEVVVAITGV